MNKNTMMVVISQVMLSALMCFLVIGVANTQPEEKKVVAQKYHLNNIRVVDGDTIYGDVNLGWEVILENQKFRIWGIDTPEVTGVEKPEGLKAKARTERFIEEGGQIVVSYGVVNDRNRLMTRGKYGRWLTRVYNEDGVNLSAILLNEGFAERYPK